jgi:hypothetical protein
MERALSEGERDLGPVGAPDPLVERPLRPKAVTRGQRGCKKDAKITNPPSKAKKEGPSEFFIPSGLIIGRGERIRTSDLLNPIQAR